MNDVLVAKFAVRLLEGIESIARMLEVLCFLVLIWLVVWVIIAGFRRR